MSLTRSQLKHDTRRIARIAGALQEHMTRYGYEPVDTPIIDSADLFLTSAGDQIMTRLFTFERHGQQLALRPEFTAQAARRYADDAAHKAETVRWQFGGAVFEDDPYDLSRQYRRYSAGAELIGLSGAAADAEIISMAAHGLTLLGLTNWRLVVGHVGLMRHALKGYGLHSRTERYLLNHRAELQPGADHILAQLDRLLPETGNGGSALPESPISPRHDSTARSQKDIARRLAEKRQRSMERQQVADAVDFLRRWGAIRSDTLTGTALVDQVIPQDDPKAAALLAEWRQVLALLAAYDIPMETITIQPDLARAWDYYTGIVFELQTADGRQVAGGGRYDELVRLIGDSADAPAVGFAYYFDQLLDDLPPEVGDEPRHVSVIARSPVEGARWVHALRREGISAVLAATVDEAGAEGSIIVEAEGSARYGGKRYALPQLRELVADLGSGQHER